MELASGDDVTVSHPLRGTARGRVEEIHKAEQLGEFPEQCWGPEQRQHIAEIVREFGATHLAIITYAAGRQRLMFGAIRINGSWFDFRGQELVITRTKRR